MEWAARIYPAQWRERYGTEFDALLEESGSGWGAIADVLKGALAMQIRTWNVWKFVVACAVIGAAIAGVISWSAPEQYVSTAVLRVDADAPAARELVSRIGQAMMSQTNLTTWISIYGLDKTDRSRTPIDDAIQDMRARTTISVVSDGPSAFKVSFRGSSPAQARGVTGALVSQFIDKNLEMRGARMEVLDRPSLPQRPTSRRFSALISIGVLMGVLAGLAAFGLAISLKRSANA
jgi:uncharacterized protein involved in exopolysaccharide biosynthesis